MLTIVIAYQLTRCAQEWHLEKYLSECTDQLYPDIVMQRSQF